MVFRYEQIHLEGSNDRAGLRTNVLNAAGIAILHLKGGKVAEGVRTWEWKQTATDRAKERNSDRNTLKLAAVMWDDHNRRDNLLVMFWGNE